MSQVMSDHTQADPHAPIIELKDAEVVFTTRAGSGLFHKNRITAVNKVNLKLCLLYTSPSPRDTR